jgi:hypothetical protein
VRWRRFSSARYELKYASARAFRQALEERIRRDYDGRMIPRIRKMIAFERFMARLDQHWILKGGYAIQLRTEKARTTQDVDLLVMDISYQDIEYSLRQEMEHNLEDYFEFVISRSAAIGAGEKNLRFQVSSRVAGREFESFHVDVGYLDPLFRPIDFLTPPNYLEFAQVETPTIPCYTIYQHIAEKVHAVWRPRTSESSRVKDLVDLILLAGLDTNIEANSLKEAIFLVFENRGDSVPSSFDSFPASWQQRYNRLAKELQLPFLDFQDAYRAASGFITPVISQHAIGLFWNPIGWQWE